jgi:hypothetical protein
VANFSKPSLGHVHNDSIASIPSILSYGQIIKGGHCKPFGYAGQHTLGTHSVISTPPPLSGHSQTWWNRIQENVSVATKHTNQLIWTTRCFISKSPRPVCRFPWFYDQKLNRTWLTVTKSYSIFDHKTEETCFGNLLMFVAGSFHHLFPFLSQRHIACTSVPLMSILAYPSDVSTDARSPQQV